MICTSYACAEAHLTILHVHLKVASRQARIDLGEKRCYLLLFALWYGHIVIDGANKLVVLFLYPTHTQEVAVVPLNLRKDSGLSGSLDPQILPVLLFEVLAHCLKNLSAHRGPPFFL